MTDDANLHRDAGGTGGKCGHAACQCTVAQGETYCSDHCRKASATPQGRSVESGCNCGHPACQSDG